jgi:hypothetical protein
MTKIPKLTKISKVAKVSKVSFVKAKNTMAIVSFANDIRPMFRPKDINCMNGQGLDLTSYNDVKANASDIYQRVSSHSMPLGGPPWTAAMIAKFNSWMTQGYPP